MGGDDSSGHDAGLPCPGASLPGEPRSITIMGASVAPDTTEGAGVGAVGCGCGCGCVAPLVVEFDGTAARVDAPGLVPTCRRLACENVFTNSKVAGSFSTEA